MSSADNEYADLMGPQKENLFTVPDDHEVVNEEEQKNNLSALDDFQQESHPEEETEKRSKKNSNPFKKRIDRLVYEKGTLEQEKNFLQQQFLEERNARISQEQRLQEYEQRLNHVSNIADSQLENSIVEKEISIRQQLKQAKLDGDVDKEIEYEDALAELKAQKTLYQHSRQQQAQQALNQSFNEEYIPYETPVQFPQRPSYPEEMQNWVDENPWYENNPRLRDMADRMADQLNDALSLSGQSVTPQQFLNTIKRSLMAANGLDDLNYGEENMTDNSYRTPPTVAPVYNRGSNYSNNADHSRNQIGRLNQEEYQIARNLPGSGYVSDVKLAERYQKAKNYPKSPLPGGTPYRLTIL